jgi:hypothetical protein
MEQELFAGITVGQALVVVGLVILGSIILFILRYVVQVAVAVLRFFFFIFLCIVSAAIFFMAISTWNTPGAG